MSRFSRFFLTPAELIVQTARMYPEATATWMAKDSEHITLLTVAPQDGGESVAFIDDSAAVAFEGI